MQYSVFGSMLAVGGMIGALISGKTADYFGHRTVRFYQHLNIKKHFRVWFVESYSSLELTMFMNLVKQTMWIINVFFILGWLAIAFTKVLSLPCFVFFTAYI